MVEKLQCSKHCYSVKMSRFIVDIHDKVIVCTRNLNPRCYGLGTAKLDTNHPHQNGQIPTQTPLAFYYRTDLIP